MTQQSVSTPKVKFATQLAPDVLHALRDIARQEGRQLQAIIDEALREYMENRNARAPRKHVLEAAWLSMARHDTLYKELAK